MAIPAFSSGQNNLHPPIWGPSRQLDDQHRNTNVNNKDHLVGQLTTSSSAVGDGLMSIWMNFAVFTQPQTAE